MKMAEACKYLRDSGVDTTVDLAFIDTVCRSMNMFPDTQHRYRELDELKLELDLIPDKTMSVNDYLEMIGE